jgi:hypothetical protein
MTWSIHQKARRGGTYDRYKDRYVVIITSDSRIRLSERVFTELGRPGYIVFVTEPGSNRWGMCAGVESNPNAYKMSLTENSNSPTASCKSFLHNQGLIPPKGQRRAYEGHMEGAYMIVETDKFSTI